MTFEELQLICFAAGAVIHGVQSALTAKAWWEARRTENTSPALCLTNPGAALAARECLAICVVAFFWQFGNFLKGLSPSKLWFVSMAALLSFPLLFSYVMGPPKGASRFVNTLVRIARLLRYPLWPWTIAAMFVVPFTWYGGPVIQITLDIMLFFFVVFLLKAMAMHRDVRSTGMGALIRANKALTAASGISAATFVVMLSGYQGIYAPYIGLAAMMTSVPFTIAVAYQLYQFPFMDAFVRESIAGSILLAAFVAAYAVGGPLIIVAAIGLAYVKAPLGRWVERRLMGYAESVEVQEERIGKAIEGLAQFDHLAARMGEILSNELEAEWVEIDSRANPRAVHRFEIPGTSSLILSVGPRVGGRSYMSRHMRLLRTTALQLATKHEQLAREALKDVTAKAQMRALQAQINPHFLFNTLNVLASLISSDPQKAERLTEQLADIFRYALESTRWEWVRLEQELQFLEAYLAIEKTRFEERLAYNFDVDPSAKAFRVPPMILQPVIENAVKHGIGPKLEGGVVTLTARIKDEGLLITVEDSGVGATASPSTRGTGIGLENIRERLRHIYGDESQFRMEPAQPCGTRVVIELPAPVGATP